MLKISNIKKAIPSWIRQREVSESELKNFYILFQELKKNETKGTNEERAKKFINDFLIKLGYYTEVNIGDDKGGGIDLAIVNEKTEKVQVIIETKASDSLDMITISNVNRKAFHETIRYYLFQRIINENLETKQIIITDYENWYIFDASEYYRLFIKNAHFKANYLKWKDGKLDGSNVKVFYQDIAKKHLNDQDISIECVKFKLSEYSFFSSEFDTLTQNQKRQVTYLFHLFSRNFLLKDYRESDSNILNEFFYKELLHILGLKENKKTKKIELHSHDNSESIIGNAISSFHQKITNYSERHLYGKNLTEQKFNIGLELGITWLNRILFLKLLEGQLKKFHKEDTRYSFLDFRNDLNFRKINVLFFEVLAEKVSNRNPEVQKIYPHIPYLNSSLFARTKLELEIGEIKDLDPEKHLDVFGKTVLLDNRGKKLSGTLCTLPYLLRFLNAYDFTSDNINGNSIKLINASVLGLIFEKINGYKEGSVFTPSSITMLMCRNTIRRKVVRKFNTVFQWNCENFDELKEEFHQHLKLNKPNRPEIREHANSIINSLKICDLAVGSGHFLVSALNELIVIKNDLNVLCYHQNYLKTLKVDIEIINDELLIETLDEELFEYKPGNEFSQKIQESLFLEKKTLIENCLFGVDINNNSTKICRLRLWIELLKNAYYTKESSYQELETLPNIDINIKTGNSLLYRFELEKHWDLIEAENKVDLKAYKDAVLGYKKSKNRREKDQFEDKIDEYKRSIRSFLSRNDEVNKKISKVREYIQASNLKVALLFGEGENDEMKKKVLSTLKKKNAKPKKQEVIINDKDWFRIGTNKEKLNLKNLDTSLSKLKKSFEEDLKEKEESILYRNAFEWRFEFPEILNEHGNFLGFDIIISNPPYMRIQEITASQPRLKEIYERDYETAKESYEFANLFVELAHRLMAKDAESSFIFPHKFLTNKNGEALRKFLNEKRSIHKMLHFGANLVFKGADTFTCIAEFSNNTSKDIKFYKTPYRIDWSKEMKYDQNYHHVSYNKILKASISYGTSQWHILDSDLEYQLFEKLYRSQIRLSDICSDIFQGLATGKDPLFILDLIEEKRNTIIASVPLTKKTYELEKILFKPLIRGLDIHRYDQKKPTKWVFFPYLPQGIHDNRKAEELAVDIESLRTDYPLTFNYVNENEKEFKSRESGRAKNWNPFYTHSRPQNLNKFEQLKLSSMEIGTIYPNIIIDRSHHYHPTTVYSWILKEKSPVSYEFLLGLANSKVLWWFFKRTGDTLKDDARRFKTNYLNPFPLPSLENKTLIKELENKVIVRELEKEKKKQKELDRLIDNVVYDLYELNEEEKQIIEDGVVWGWISK